MSTVTAVVDNLSPDVPRLDPTGSNWAIFVERFHSAVEAKNKWGHFDGSSQIPIFVNLPITQAQSDAIMQWCKDKSTANNLLISRIPDSTVLEVHQ